MTTSASPPANEALGRHLPARLDEARLARQSEGIAARVAAAQSRRAVRRPLRRAAVAASALGVVALVLALPRARTHDVLQASATSALVAGTVLETAAGGETITLLDGSRAVLEPGSRLRLIAVQPRLVRVGLERGGLDLDGVAATDEVVVLARDYQVRVLGARLHARVADASRLTVEVARGRVVVTRTDDPASVRTLDAGETWSTGGLAPTPRRDDAPAAIPATSAPAYVGARELLARAEAARAANDPRASARLLDQLRVRHRSDPRAGLAAFELGRLRLDRLGDPVGAAEALNDALALSPEAPFREDAEARLVEAYDGAGDQARCLAARSRYLARHPQGVHRDKVARRCVP